jgi:hypothetical protein
MTVDWLQLVALHQAVVTGGDAAISQFVNGERRDIALASIGEVP